MVAPARLRFLLNRARDDRLSFLADAANLVSAFSLFSFVNKSCLVCDSGACVCLDISLNTRTHKARLLVHYFCFNKHGYPLIRRRPPLLASTINIEGRAAPVARFDGPDPICVAITSNKYVSVSANAKQGPRQTKLCLSKWIKILPTDINFHMLFCIFCLYIQACCRFFHLKKKKIFFSDDE